MALKLAHHQSKLTIDDARNADSDAFEFTIAVASGSARLFDMTAAQKVLGKTYMEVIWNGERYDLFAFAASEVSFACLWKVDTRKLRNDTMPSYS